MVSKSEAVVYYSTTLLTVFIFLTDAGAVATNYNKSALLDKPGNASSLDPNKFSYNITKLAPAERAQSGPLANQDQKRPDVTSRDKSNLKKSDLRYTRREILQLSGSGGAGEHEAKNKSVNDGGDDEKTLSQQVADGKYGLIQNEIFTAKPPRLGVISYDVNPEVPKDNANNFGGLEPDDIWLAENHLLVLAGGGLNGLQTQWRPIDNYEAPQRPVKLPANPKIPPPFPVQLVDNGPIEYVKPSNTQSDNLPFNSFNPFSAAVDKFQFYPPLIRGKPESAYYPLQSPFKSPPLPPSLVKPPPGAEFLPPYLINANMSDVDEDDPSLYYPPPYDFIYQKDNVSRIPAGPLVPGIVLPPPPNFFSPLLNDSTVPSKSNEIKLTKFKSGKRLKFVTDKPMIPSALDTSTIKYDDIFNEITFPRAYKNKDKYSNGQITNTRDEEEQDEWIPIPAPKPFFITGEKTPLQNAILQVTTHDFSDPYAYNYKKANLLKPNARKPASKYLQYREPSEEPFQLTTPTSPRQILSTKSPFPGAGVPSTTPIPSPVQPTIKATYYFYEEPREDDAVLSKPLSTSPPYVPPDIEIDKIVPAKQIIVPSNKAISKDEKKRKPITPLIPIYYLAELDNLVDSIEPMQPLYPPPSTPQTELLHSIRQQSTPKPIFEYDYVAANYNNNQSPIFPHSTLSPPLFNYNNYYHQPPPRPSQYENIFNSIAQFSKPYHHTTAKPTLYFPNNFLQNNPADDTFNHLWLPSFNYYQQLASYSTENPYHAFFTKEEANLVDDNTKEFFTVFGKKIKQHVESTSPLPLQTSAPVALSADRWKSKHKSNNEQPTATDGYVSYSTSPVPVQNQNTNKPLSLAGDTNVNYVTPLPPVNPDAEVIPGAATFRPIVVDDFPADYQKRLNNIVNFPQRAQSDQFRSQNYGVPVYQRYNTHGSYYDIGTRQGVASSPVSLHSDINVNFRSKFAQNPEAEFIGGSSPIEYTQRDNSREYDDERDDGNESRTPRPVSLKNDVLVNYKNRNRLSVNPDAEYIGSGEQTVNQNDDRGSISSSETIVAYNYPGVEHGHYYFLTPRETRYKNSIKNRRGNSQSNGENLDEYFRKKIERNSSAERFR